MKDLDFHKIILAPDLRLVKNAYPSSFMSVLKRGSKDLQILGKMERSLMRISRDLDKMFINEIDLSLGGRAMERGEHEKIYYGSPDSDTQAVDRIKNLYAAVPARMMMKKPYAGIFDMDESSKAALHAWLGILSRFQSNAANFLNRLAACKQSSEPVKCLRQELEKLKKDIQAIESAL